MIKIIDQEHLIKDQYATTLNLDARQYLQYNFNTNPYNFYAWIFDHFALDKKAYIFELGCGLGDLWIQNKARIPKGWRLTLTDISKAMVDKTKNVLSNLQQDINYRVIDAQKIPFDNALFDAVIANHMLYHVPDRKKALSEIVRVLKTEGKLYATTTGLNHMIELNHLLNEFHPGLRMWDTESSQQFILENGSEQLSQFFKNVKLYSYRDSLVVPTISPIINYIMTTQAKVYLTGKKYQTFREFVENKIKQNPLHITKALGLFVAQN